MKYGSAICLGAASVPPVDATVIVWLCAATVDVWSKSYGHAAEFSNLANTYAAEPYDADTP